MNEKDRRNQCPDIEALSAFYDGEIAPDSWVARHLETCPDCRRVVAAFAALSDRLKARLARQVPLDLADRIRTGVHQQLDQEQRRRRTERRAMTYPGTLLKVAAAFVIGFGLLFYVVGRLVNKDVGAGSGTGTAGRALDVVRNRAPEIRKGEELSQDGLARPVLNVGGTVPFSELEAVSFGFDPALDRLPAGIGNQLRWERRQAVIPNRVQHVWVAGDLERVARQLLEFAAVNQVPANKMMVSRTGDNKIKANFRLNKEQLVQLVRLCSASGLELLSPQSPQPEERRFAGNGEAPVQYNADFVLTEK